MISMPTRSHPLTDSELYLFDTMGFVSLPGFLSSGGVELLRSEALALSSQIMSGRGDKERFDDLAGRSSIFAELARSPGLLAPAESVINQPFRLIESYALRRSGPSAFYLHNGNSEALRYGGSRVARRNMSFDHTYHDGKLYCIFVKLLIYLSNVWTDADGPFCYLQGSHKANFARFPDSEEITPRPALTVANFPSLTTAPASAGDALLLNEALLHGTLPKFTTDERIVLAFSYAPAFVTDWHEIDIESTVYGQLGHY